MFSAFNMDVFKIGALSIISLCAIVVLRTLKPEWAMLVRLSAIIILFAAMIPMIGVIIGYARELAGFDGGEFVGQGTLEILIKALCIGLLTHVTASVCRDAGEGGIAALSEMAGKIEIILLSFPLIKEIIDTALSLLKLQG